MTVYYADGTEKGNAPGGESCTQVYNADGTPKSSLSSVPSAVVLSGDALTISDNTETTIGTYTIPAASISSQHVAFVMTILGSWTNNTGANQGFRIKLKWGGTTFIDYNTGSVFGSAATIRPHKIEATLKSRPDGTQSVWLEWTLPTISVVGTITAGNGQGYTQNTAWQMLNDTTAAKSMASAQTLSVTITQSATSASLTWVRDHIRVIQWTEAS